MHHRRNVLAVDIKDNTESLPCGHSIGVAEVGERLGTGSQAGS
jgi:hypothetical protein